MSLLNYDEKHIVLTGGPCSGKTTAISILKTELENKGYKVFIAEEIPTALVRAGITPISIGMMNFESLILKSHQMMAEVIETAKLSLRGSDKVIVIHDRAELDCGAYVSEEEMQYLLQHNNETESSIFEKYDGVFHLVTIARDVPDLYTTANNIARRESVEEAIEADEKTIKCWVGHPHLRVIPNRDTDGNIIDFNKKMGKLKAEIFSLLGIPVPLETEYKFAIKALDISDKYKLIKEYGGVEVDILQTYLKSLNGEERRVRARTLNGVTSYTYTEKRLTEHSDTRIETEERISYREYQLLLREADKELKPVSKRRCCFVYNNMYYELDEYAEASKLGYSIVEIELSDRSDRSKIIFPEFIHPIREVTDDINFKNRTIAERGCKALEFN